MKKTIKKSQKSVKLEFEGIPYQVVHRRVKYSRVEFKPDGLVVIIPRRVKPLDVLTSNRESILRKYYRYRGDIDASKRTPLVERTDEQFLTIVTQYLETFSNQLGVPVPTLKFRKMRRRWGSCRSDGIVTLNRFLQFVPEHLIAYIIYHELAHFIVRGHNREFRNLVASGFPNYVQLDKELTIYGLKLLSQ